VNLRARDHGRCFILRNHVAILQYELNRCGELHVGGHVVAGIFLERLFDAAALGDHHVWCCKPPQRRFVARAQGRGECFDHAFRGVRRGCGPRRIDWRTGSMLFAFRMHVIVPFA